MSNSGSLQLLNNGSATSAALQWQGGKGLFSLIGVLASGFFEHLGSDGSTWITVQDTTGNGITISLGATLSRSFELPPVQVRFRVTAGSGIYAYAERIPGNWVQI